MSKAKKMEVLSRTISIQTYYPSNLASDHERVPSNLANDLKETVMYLAEEVGERNCYRSRNLEKAATWIEQQFIEMGYSTHRLPVEVPAGPPYRCGPMTVWNIEVQKEGSSLDNEVVIVGAHYDSKVASEHWRGRGRIMLDQQGTPGANDNASGIAAVLALARYFSERSTERSIRFVAFVNEEPPFFLTEAMGSHVYAHRIAEDKSIHVVGAITPDLIGCYSKQVSKKRLPLGSLFGLPDRSDYVAFMSNWHSRLFARQCAQTFMQHSRIDVRTLALPFPFKFVAWSDDWSFWQQGIPAFTVTDTAYMRSQDYHEITDTADKLDYPEMADVVWGLVHVLDGLVNPGKEGVEPVES